MLFVSDVHANFDALAALVKLEEPIAILGDLVNLVDYRTGEGVFADVLGVDFVKKAAWYRRNSDFVGLRKLWQSVRDEETPSVSEQIRGGVARQYQEMSQALSGGVGYVIHGNADNPDELAKHLPAGWSFVSGKVICHEEVKLGFVGGGSKIPLPVPGEATEDEVAGSLASMKEVSVLGTHIPPEFPAVRTDVITGRPERASAAILAFIHEHQPRFHLYGDVHQPQANQWRIGNTQCLNTGYFRATRRALRLRLGGGMDFEESWSWVRV